MLKKITILICMLVTIGLSCANNFISTDGLTIQSSNCGEERTDVLASIIASINGHTLTVSFLSNIGQVTVKVLDENNLTLDLLTTPTPTGYLYYIPNAGRYTVVFTFADGDEYYGEFEVTE